MGACWMLALGMRASWLLALGMRAGWLLALGMRVDWLLARRIPARRILPFMSDTCARVQ